jgi:Holliday junction resolvase-like predicted endonuclease
MFVYVHWRTQGDLGEVSALEWLVARGYQVYVPLGHSADCDLVADIDGRLERVQVKTSICRQGTRYAVMLATKGGNRSWTGTVKRFSADRCDWLFVLVGDGRRWWIPSAAVEACTAVTLGGPKYSEYEVEPGRPLPLVAAA